MQADETSKGSFGVVRVLHCARVTCACLAVACAGAGAGGSQPDPHDADDVAAPPAETTPAAPLAADAASDAKIFDAFDRALAFGERGDVEAALAVVSRARGMAAALYGADALEVAVAYNVEGRILFFASRYAEAEEALLSALTIAAKHDDLEAATTYLANLVEAQLRLGEYGQALRFAEQCLQANRTLRAEGDEGRSTANAWRLVARARHGLGDLEGSVSSAREALAEDLERHGEQSLASAADRALLADYLAATGDQEGALRMALAAHATRTALLAPDTPGYAKVADSLAQLAGLYSRARQHYFAVPLREQVVEIRRRLFGARSLRVGVAQLDLAHEFFEAGRPEDALHTAAESSELLKSQGASTLTLERARLLLGKLLIKGNDADYRAKGLEILRWVASGQAERDDRVSLQQTLQLVAAGCALTGDYAGAQRESERAQQIALELYGAGSVGSVSAQLNGAFLLLEAGAFGEAARRYRMALADLDRFRTPIDFGSSRVHGALLALWRSGRTSTSLEEAFAIAQRGHRSEAAQALAQAHRRNASGHEVLTNALRRKQDLEHALSLAHGQIALLFSRSQTVDADASAAALQRLRETEAALAQAHREVERLSPAYASAQREPALDVPTVQRHLRSDEALLAFSFGPKVSFVWLIQPDSAQWAELPIDADALADEVTTLRRGLERGVPGLRGVSESAAGTQRADLGAPHFDMQRAHRLYRRLFGAVEASLGDTQHLWVVPSGALDRLPLSVLLTEPPPSSHAPRHARAPWLIRKYAVTVLPSVGTLPWGDTSVSTPSGAHRPARFLGVGDPDMTAFATMASSDGCPLAARRTAGAVSALGKLEDTADELHRVAKRLGSQAPQALWLGSRASLESLPRLDGFDTLMFATHATRAGELPGVSEPALVLSPSGACNPQSGLLLASDVARMRLSADWVVLSACNTAAPDGAPNAGGFSGLARAFLYAGARALLVSHWAVRSDAAVELTTRTFDILARNPSTTKAGALRAAILHLLDDQPSEAEAHPSYWAPFEVVAGR